MEFSGVIGAASEIADGEGADDDSAEKDENRLTKSEIAQSISDEVNVELPGQNGAKGEDTSGGNVAGIGNCSKLKSSNDPKSSNGQRGLYPISAD